MDPSAPPTQQATNNNTPTTVIKTYEAIKSAYGGVPRYFIGNFARDRDFYFERLKEQMDEAIRSDNDIRAFAQQTIKVGKEWTFPDDYKKVSDEVLRGFDKLVVDKYGHSLHLWKEHPKREKDKIRRRFDLKHTNWALVQDEREQDKLLKKVLAERKEYLIKQEFHELKPSADGENGNKKRRRKKRPLEQREQHHSTGDTSALTHEDNPDDIQLDDDAWKEFIMDEDNTAAVEAAVAARDTTKCNDLEDEHDALLSAPIMETDYHHHQPNSETLVQDVSNMINTRLESFGNAVQDNLQDVQQGIGQDFDEARRKANIASADDSTPDVFVLMVEPERALPGQDEKTVHMGGEHERSGAENEEVQSIRSTEAVAYPFTLNMQPIELEAGDDRHTDRDETDSETKPFFTIKWIVACLLVLITILVVAVLLVLLPPDTTTVPTLSPSLAPQHHTASPSYQPSFTPAVPIPCESDSYWALDVVTPGIPIDKCEVDGKCIRSRGSSDEAADIFTSADSTIFCSFRLCPGATGFISAPLVTGSMQNTLFLSNQDRVYAGTASVVSSLTSGDIVRWTKNVGKNDSGFEFCIDDFLQVGNDIDGEAKHDWLGHAVAMSGNGTIVAGGALYNDGAASRAGHVRVHRWTGNRWEQMGNDIDGELENDEAGYSVSISESGTIVAVGARWHTFSGLAQRGNIRVFKFDDISQTWNQLGNTMYGEEKGDEFGFAVSISKDGSTVAGGARHNGARVGQVQVFRFDGSGWIKLGSTLQGKSSDIEFGHSVSLSEDGTTLAVGARFSPVGGSGRGLVRVYKYDSWGWSQIGLDINGISDDDQLGASVSLSQDGSVLAAGAVNNTNLNGENAGQVRIFKFENHNWNLLGNPLNGEAPFDRFGYSVALSADGTVVAGGSRWHDDGGHVQIYQYDGTQWNHLKDIDGESIGDQCGSSVALSSNGAFLAIGARNNSGIPGQYSGHVRVFVSRILGGAP